MAQFASDGFSGTEGSELSAYNSAWTRHPSYSVSAEIASGRLRASAAGGSVYYYSGTPASADYSVSADVYEASDAGYGAGPVARVVTGAHTFYHARWFTSDAPDTLQLYKFIAGAATQLGSSVADNLTTGDTQNLKLECIGSAIKVYSRGSGIASISQIDTSITAPGKAGVRMGYAASAVPSDTACLHLDNFSADDIGSAHDLIAATATGTSAASAAAITQDRALAGAASAQGNAGNTALINQAHVLAVSAPIQANSSAAAAITQVRLLAGANSTQGNPGGAGAISVSGDFIGAASTQANPPGTGQITLTQTLTGTNPVQANPSGSGAISDGIVVEAALTTGIVQTIRIKKPGIPAGTPEWLKTLLEIILGRRGNAIDVPEFRMLTFSAIPTKAECEALYSYTNEVRKSVENILARLDS